MKVVWYDALFFLSIEGASSTISSASIIDSMQRGSGPHIQITKETLIKIYLSETSTRIYYKFVFIGLQVQKDRRGETSDANRRPLRKYSGSLQRLHEVWWRYWSLECMREYHGWVAR